MTLEQKKVDFNCLAISNFASEQWNLKNPYSFCENPLNYVYKTNILNNRNFNFKNLKMIEKEILALILVKKPLRHIESGKAKKC